MLSVLDMIKDKLLEKEPQFKAEGQEIDIDTALAEASFRRFLKRIISEELIMLFDVIKNEQKEAIEHIDIFCDALGPGDMLFLSISIAQAIDMQYFGSVIEIEEHQ